MSIKNSFWNKEFLLNFSILKEIIKLFLEKDFFVEKKLYISFLLIVITMSLNVSTPFFLEKLVATISSPSVDAPFLILCLGISYGISWTVSQATMQLREISAYPALARCIRKFTIKLFSHIIRQSYKTYTDQQIGSLIGTIKEVQDGLPYLFCGLFFYLLPTICEMSIIITILILIVPYKFSIVFLCMFFSYSILSVWGLNKLSPGQRLVIDKSHTSDAHLADTLLNFELIKIFATQRVEIERMESCLEDVETVQVRAHTLSESLRLGQGVLLGLHLIFLMWLGTQGLIKKEIDLSHFILINAYFIQLTSPLNVLGMVIKDIKEGLLSLERAFKIIDGSCESESFFSPIVIPFCKNVISLKNVFFSYQNSQPVLQDISFILEPGKITSLVGETGSGKSTIAKLLIRLYQPLYGEIHLNEINIKEYTSETICKLIGFVPQETSLFRNTLLYNLTYGNSAVSPEEINNALEKASLVSFVKKLPQGLNTLVGERGLSLSGGERQRLALARAFLAKRSIYIFDEATSSLDPETQETVTKSIKELSKKASILTISHRLSTIVESDEILVLSHGKIAERGNHFSLLSTGGIYSRLWKCATQEQFDGKVNRNVAGGGYN